MTVFYFSGSGHSLAVAEALAQILACKTCRIDCGTESPAEETAAVVFPVYCQNIPKPVKQFLKQLQAEHVALIATYGKISYGRVLYEAQRMVKGDVIAGAYIPMGHTFLDGSCVFDRAQLLPVAERMKSPQRVHIPKTRKNPLANLFPALRSRLGVTIIKGDQCNHCGTCEKVCPVGPIRGGKSGSSCIRCLSCVSCCPQSALGYKNSRILDRYLKHDCREEYVLYL